jgi:large subunit ribosomal protein L17
MLANMAASLILHKRIQTTTAKAKALRMFVEPLITKSKSDSTHTRRVVFSYLQSKEAVSELFREVSPKIAERPGGYTRILKTGKRLGDNADMCIIELVDYNENLLSAKEEAAAKSGRKRRRGSKKKSEGGEVVAATATAESIGSPDVTKVEVSPSPESESVASVVLEDTKQETSGGESQVTAEMPAEEEEADTATNEAGVIAAEEKPVEEKSEEEKDEEEKKEE